MIVLPTLHHQTVGVLGLAGSGLAVCRALAKSGARVWGWDDDPARRASAALAGVPIVELDLCNWQRLACLVVSPGVPLKHPRPHRLVRRARAAGVRLLGDIELLAENQPERKVVGVTGTNGKSTTAALIDRLLREAAIGTQLGGNIGLPVLDLLPKPDNDIYVLELSSYQLDLTERLKCAAAVILNITPDHLDRHGGMAGYVRAKKRILRNQDADDCAVIGVDDDHGRALLAQLRRKKQQRVVPISALHALDEGVHVEDGRLIDSLDGAGTEVMDLRPIKTLQGRHNWQNAAAAYAAVRALGVPAADAVKGFSTFTGLPHRLELVAEFEGVRFVNDSKATNPDAAARALACFEEIYWIAGGRPKQNDLEGLAPFLDRVKRAYLIGEAAPLFRSCLEGRVDCVMSGDLETAVMAAAEDAAHAVAARGAAQGPTVLLAPASASFDQFRNFEERGDRFRALAQSLDPKSLDRPRLQAAGR
jgi:UDP-N-acetylmuramoylalanine--D-glutamate ligase